MMSNFPFCGMWGPILTVLVPLWYQPDYDFEFSLEGVELRLSG